MYEASTRHWRSGPLRLLTGVHDRRIGLRPAPGPVGALFRARSVHTFGMTGPIGVVVIGSRDVVLSARMLAPRRVTWWPRGRWVIEVPAKSGLPRRGERVELRWSRESG